MGRRNQRLRARSGDPSRWPRPPRPPWLPPRGRIVRSPEQLRPEPAPLCSPPPTWPGPRPPVLCLGAAGGAWGAGEELRARQQVPGGRAARRVPALSLTPAGAPEAGVRAQRFELAAVGGPRPAPHARAAPLQPLGVNDVPEVRADGGRQEHEAERPGQRRRARQRAQVHPHGAAGTAARGSQLRLPSLGTRSRAGLPSASPPSGPGSALRPSPAPADLPAPLPQPPRPRGATATLRPRP